MAELERIYKDTDTGGWGWVTQEATGGGGGATEQTQYFSNASTVDPATLTKLKINDTSDPVYPDQPHLLDLSGDLTQPTVVDAGTYAVSVVVIAVATAGKRAYCYLQMNDTDDDGGGFVSSTLSLDDIDYGDATHSPPQTILPLTWKMQAGQALFCSVKHNADDPVEFGLEVMIAKIA